MNEFLLARTFAPRYPEIAQTVPVAIAAFTGAVEFQRPIGRSRLPVVVTIPMIIVALIFQKRIVAGLTAGSVKG